jgi:hypothetical protein
MPTLIRVFLYNALGLNSPLNGGQLSMRVTPDEDIKDPDVYNDSNDDDNANNSSYKNDELFESNYNYLVNMELTFTPCPSDYCVHGECLLSTGDIPVASCACRYRFTYTYVY